MDVESLIGVYVEYFWESGRGFGCGRGGDTKGDTTKGADTTGGDAEAGSIRAGNASNLRLLTAPDLAS